MQINSKPLQNVEGTLATSWVVAHYYNCYNVALYMEIDCQGPGDKVTYRDKHPPIYVNAVLCNKFICCL